VCAARLLCKFAISDRSTLVTRICATINIYKCPQFNLSTKSIAHAIVMWFPIVHAGESHCCGLPEFLNLSPEMSCVCPPVFVSKIGTRLMACRVSREEKNTLACLPGKDSHEYQHFMIKCFTLHKKVWISMEWCSSSLGESHFDLTSCRKALNAIIRATGTVHRALYTHIRGERERERTRE